MTIYSLTTRIENNEDYLPLPDSFDIHEYSIIANYCEGVENQQWQSELLTAIRRSGAFRRFKSKVRQLGIEEDWYQYRQRALEQIAIRWLESNSIGYRK